MLYFINSKELQYCLIINFFILLIRETILQKSSGINDSGHLIWQLIVGLIVAWIIIWAMVIKGIKVIINLRNFQSWNMN